MIFIAKYQVSKERLKEVMYGRIVVDYWPQKADSHWKRLMVGGNLIKYTGDLSKPAADITTSNIIINITISTPVESYMCCDIKITT